MNGRAFVSANQFVLKVHSRCDLACDYCYVYESLDHSWRDRPVVANSEVISRRPSASLNMSRPTT